MPKPDGGLIRENNLQYYAGAQIIYTATPTAVYDFTFNTKLVLGSTDSYAPSDPNYTQNNFKIFTSPNGINNYTEYITAYTLAYIQDGPNVTSRITLAQQPAGTYVKVQLKEGAVEDNYGSYEYIKLKDIINNFIVAYVGQDKLIPRVNRTDVIFHADVLAFFDVM